jgi:hypothetical protein
VHPNRCGNNFLLGNDIQRTKKTDADYNKVLRSHPPKITTKEAANQAF